MSIASLKENFLQLPRHAQIVGPASLVLAIATFLPWYADVDSYRIGDQFLGITGPGALVGFSILAFALISLGLFTYRLLGRNVPKIPVPEGVAHMFFGVQSLFLLLIINSIYFDVKFGVNITDKEAGFGMPIAVVSAIMLGIGGYMQWKMEASVKDEIGKLEPLISIENTAKQTSEGQAQNSTDRPHVSLPPRKIFPRQQPGTIGRFGHIPGTQQRGFTFGEKPASAPEQRTEPSSSPKPQSAGRSGSFMIRTDL